MPGFIVTFSAVSCSRSSGCGGCCGSASGSGNYGRWGYYWRWWGWLAINNAIWGLVIIATIPVPVVPSVRMVMWDSSSSMSVKVISSMAVISIVMAIVTPPAVVQSEVMSMTMSPVGTVGKNSLRCE